MKSHSDEGGHNFGGLFFSPVQRMKSGKHKEELSVQDLKGPLLQTLGK
jgi:hypothetical protein